MKVKGGNIMNRLKYLFLSKIALIGILVALFTSVSNACGYMSYETESPDFIK